MKPSRRDFGIGLAAFGALASLGGLGRAWAAAPVRGGTLTVATPDTSTTDTLDPGLAASFTDQFRGFVIYNKLTQIDGAGKLVPELAESWTSNDSATEWVFELRKGVTFHDGAPFTSADAAYSVLRVKDPAFGSGAAGLLRDVVEARADGPDRLVVKLTTSNAQFPNVLSVRQIAIVKDGATDLNKNPIGTGAWKVAAFTPGVSASLVRYDGYWASDRPYIDRIESIGVADRASRINAFLSGEVDVIQGIDAQTMGRINSSGVGRVMSITGGQHVTFPMRADMAPFDNADVRNALKIAFDRERFIQLAFGGRATVGRDNPISPTDQFFSDNVPVPTADPDKVKFLLNKAGHANSTFELVTSDSALGGPNASVVLAELMRVNGVNVSVKKVPSEGYFTTVWKKVPWCTSYFSGRPTTVGCFETGYVTGAPDNEAGWTSTKLDDLIKQAKAERDNARAAQLLEQAQLLCSADGATIIPCFIPWVDAVSNRVMDMEPNPRAALGAGRWDSVWLQR